MILIMQQFNAVYQFLLDDVNYFWSSQWLNIFRRVKTHKLIMIGFWLIPVDLVVVD